MTLVWVLAACQGFDAHLSSDGLAGTTEVDVSVPVLLQDGFNDVEVPAGVGPPHLAVWPWEKALLPARFGDAASRTSYYFATVPWAPAPGRNVHFFAEIAATSRQEADSVMDVLRGHFEELLQGLDPGPLPFQVENIAFWSWEVIESGPDAGDVEFFAARPGTRVDDFELRVNAFTASPGNGAVSSTLGPWQLVEVVVPSREIHRPETGVPATNSWSILVDTDVDEPMTESGELSIELVP